MLAFIYLILMFVLGDSICRRFYSFVSLPHRLASAFLCGLLITSWWTYLSGLLFAGTASPLFWGNVLFFLTAGGAIYWLAKRPPRVEPDDAIDPTIRGFRKWDWITLGLSTVLTCWLMFGTFQMDDGTIQVAHH